MEDAGLAGDYPEVDPEAHMLCAAMWSRDRPQLQFITEHMTADDFATPFYGTIFAGICQAIDAGLPHDPASIGAAFARAGTTASSLGVHRALRTIATLGSPPEALEHHAADVAAASYRRGYFILSEKIAHIAELAHTDELFDLLVEQGTHQRAEAERLRTIQNGPQRNH